MNYLQVVTPTMRDLTVINHMAQVVASSSLYHSNPATVEAMMLKSLSLGLNPITAIDKMYVVKMASGGSKIALENELLNNLIHRSPYLNDLEEIQNRDKNGVVESVTIKMSRFKRIPADLHGEWPEWVFADRNLRKAEYTFGKNDAEGIYYASGKNLASKDNYKNYAPLMYRWRCISYIASLIFPDIVNGFKSSEEMNQDVQAGLTETIQESAESIDLNTEEIEAGDFVEIDDPMEVQEKFGAYISNHPKAAEIMKENSIPNNWAEFNAIIEKFGDVDEVTEE